jgi:hypothetical protein
MRKVVEIAALHRLANVPLHEAFPAVGRLPSTIGVASLRGHGAMVATPCQAS